MFFHCIATSESFFFDEYFRADREGDSARWFGPLAMGGAARSARGEAPRRRADRMSRRRRDRRYRTVPSFKEPGGATGGAAGSAKIYFRICALRRRGCSATDSQSGETICPDNQ